MKVIFSRKGFDSGAGGVPSPIVDGRPLMLPIPTRQPSCTTFGHLGAGVAEMVSDLTGGRLGRDSCCHLDPDLDSRWLPQRHPDWRASLGQAGAAQAHLANCGVGVGDLFLFWGLYRPAEQVGGKWRFHGRRRHVVFGWLQVGAIVQLGPDGSGALTERPWLADHPHARAGWPATNTLHVASDEVVLDGATGLPGAGVLRQGHVLTDMSADRCSVWKVPAWLDPTIGGTGLTYHPESRWLGDGRLQSAARGQEFVANAGRRSEVFQWIHSLLEDGQ